MSLVKRKNRKLNESSATARSSRLRSPRRGLWALLVAGASALACFGLHRWALASETFALRRVVFSGNERATEPELLHLAGLQRGQNIVGLDLTSVERALATHPWVVRAEARRRFPSTVDVQVVEHEPKGLVALGDLYVVGASGEPFKRLAAQDGLDLPVISGLRREDYVARPAQTVEDIREALALLAAYGASALTGGATVSEVRVSAERLTLVTAEGQEVRFPRAEPAGEALARLARVKTELSRRGVVADVIHLDNRTRPDRITVHVATPPERAPGP